MKTTKLVGQWVGSHFVGIDMSVEQAKCFRAAIAGSFFIVIKLEVESVTAIETISLISCFVSSGVT